MHGVVKTKTTGQVGHPNDVAEEVETITMGLYVKYAAEKQDIQQLIVILGMTRAIWGQSLGQATPVTPLEIIRLAISNRPKLVYGQCGHCPYHE